MTIALLTNTMPDLSRSLINKIYTFPKGRDEYNKRVYTTKLIIHT